MMYDVHCVIRHTLPALWTRQPARVGQPAQFDPAVMAASTRAMEQKANMGAGNLGTQPGAGAPSIMPGQSDAATHAAVAMAAASTTAAGGAHAAAATIVPGQPASIVPAIPGQPGDMPMTAELMRTAQAGNSPMPPAPGGGLAPVPRGQMVPSPMVGAPPYHIKGATLSALKSGPSENPFAHVTPPAQAFESNPLAYAAPGVTVVHPSLVGAAAVMEISPSAPATSAYLGMQLPYHPDQAMVNGAQRARDYLMRSHEGLRPGEGLGYGAGAFPPPHHPGIPPKFGGSVNGFATKFGAPGAGVAGGPRQHVVTPGFTPHGRNAIGMPVSAFERRHGSATYWWFLWASLCVVCAVLCCVLLYCIVGL